PDQHQALLAVDLPYAGQDGPRAYLLHPRCPFRRSRLRQTALGAAYGKRTSSASARADISATSPIIQPCPALRVPFEKTRPTRTRCGSSTPGSLRLVPAACARRRRRPSPPRLLTESRRSG